MFDQTSLLDAVAVMAPTWLPPPTSTTALTVLNGMKFLTTVLRWAENASNTPRLTFPVMSLSSIHVSPLRTTTPVSPFPSITLFRTLILYWAPLAAELGRAEGVERQKGFCATCLSSLADGERHRRREDGSYWKLLPIDHVPRMRDRNSRH